MRRQTTFFFALSLLLAVPLFADGPRRAVGHPSSPAADPNIRLIWVAEAHTSWEDAAAAFVSNQGRLSILRTGHPATPFVVLRQVPSGSYAVFPPPKYTTVTFTDMVSAMPFISSVSWWRGLTTEDGTALIVMLNAD